jgi:hypothetical protein
MTYSSDTAQAVIDDTYAKFGRAATYNEVLTCGS